MQLSPLQRLPVVILSVLVLAWLALGLRNSRLEDEAVRSVDKRVRLELAGGERTGLDPGETDRILSLFRRAQRLNPDVTPMLNEANVYLFNGRFEPATAILEEVVRREPENLFAWMALEDAARTVDSRLSAEARARVRRLNPIVAERR